MKKLLLLLTAAFFLTPDLKSQLLTESFDGPTFPPTGWTTVQVGGGPDVWLRSTASTQTIPNGVTPHSGAAMALYDAYTYYYTSSNLSTPALNFTAGVYRLKFWMYRDSRYSSSDDSLEVFVSATSPSGGGTKIGRVGRHYLDAPAQASTGWYEYTFNIPASFNTATNYVIFRGVSEYGTEILVDDITVELNLSCSGTPTGGSASASPVTLCAAGSSTLTLSGASATPGINYQWESSPAGANTFTAIPAATGTTYNATVAASTDYRVLVTCTNGGLTSYSSIATVSISSVPGNDLVCNATALTLGGSADCANTTCATSTSDPTLPGSCSTPNNTVWYKYTAVANGPVALRLTTPAAGNLYGWAAWYTATGSCPTLSLTTFSPLCQSFGDVNNDTDTLLSPSLVSGTTYYIMIDGNSGASGAFCINIIAPPPPPSCVTNVSPANGATGVAIAPNAPITWNASPGASSYDVYFGTVNPPTTNIGNIAAPATTANITGLLYSTTYYWYIVPKGSGGDAVGCSTNTTSFTTVPPPPNCVPITSTGCGSNDRIELFRLKGESSQLNINVGTACPSNAYTDTTDHPVIIDLARGKSYWGQTMAGTTGDYLTLWLDANDNGIYENTERLMNNLLMSNSTPGNVSLFIPVGTALGNHRLRARLVYYGSTAPTVVSDPCGSYTYSDTKDFMVNITAAGSTYAVASYAGGACYADAGSITVDAASNNNTNYVPLVDSSNALIAQLYPQGNDFGTVSTSYFKNTGAVRQDQQSRYYLDRNITITVSKQPTVPYSIRLHFLTAELNALIAQPGSGVTSVFDLGLTKNADACLSAIGTAAGAFYSPSGFGSLGGDRFLDFTGLTVFSSFYLHGGSTPIPVTLMSFTAQRTGKVNQLNWSTSQEINTSHFVLERSTDGRQFTDVATIAAAGNSSTTRNYNYTDNNPVRGINYYRLRIVDKDNSVKYSWVRNVRNEGVADIAVYPNPVKDVLTVSISADKAANGQMIITDISGKMIYSKNVSVVQGNNNLPVDMSRLAAGAYLIKVQLADDVVVRKFNKL